MSASHLMLATDGGDAGTDELYVGVRSGDDEERRRSSGDDGGAGSHRASRRSGSGSRDGDDDDDEDALRLQEARARELAAAAQRPTMGLVSLMKDGRATVLQTLGADSTLFATLCALNVATYHAARGVYHEKQAAVARLDALAWLAMTVACAFFAVDWLALAVYCVRAPTCRNIVYTLEMQRRAYIALLPHALRKALPALDAWRHAPHAALVVYWLVAATLRNAALSLVAVLAFGSANHFLVGTHGSIRGANLNNLDGVHTEPILHKLPAVVTLLLAAWDTVYRCYYVFAVRARDDAVATHDDASLGAYARYALAALLCAPLLTALAAIVALPAFVLSFVVGTLCVPLALAQQHPNLFVCMMNSLWTPIVLARLMGSESSLASATNDEEEYADRSRMSE